MFVYLPAKVVCRRSVVSLWTLRQAQHCAPRQSPGLSFLLDFQELRASVSSSASQGWRSGACLASPSSSLGVRAARLTFGCMVSLGQAMLLDVRSKSGLCSCPVLQWESLLTLSRTGGMLTRTSLHFSVSLVHLLILC